MIPGEAATPARARPRRRRRTALIAQALLTLGLVPTAAAAVAVAASAAVSQTPDVTDTRYRSLLTHVTPATTGVSWRVIDSGDEIELVNRSHRTVTVYGYSASSARIAYDGGPYARILGDGSVQINERSPAYYLNKSFYADYANVPASASATALPEWVTLARTGAFTWHDHRIHYTSPAVPLAVRDVHRTTFVFDWYIPIEVGSTRGYLAGALYWIGQKPFSFPLAAIVALVVLVVGGGAFVIIVRRRRRRPGAPREVW